MEVSLGLGWQVRWLVGGADSLYKQRLGLRRLMMAGFSVNAYGIPFCFFFLLGMLSCCLGTYLST